MGTCALGNHRLTNHHHHASIIRGYNIVIKIHIILLYLLLFVIYDYQFLISIFPPSPPLFYTYVFVFDK